MKYKKIFATITFLITAFYVKSVSALDLGGGYLRGAGKVSGYNEQTTDTTFAEMIGTVIQAALSLVGVIFVTLMVYAGYLWMTARGESDQIEKSKNIIRASIIGLIITMASYGITAFIVPKVLESTTTSIPLVLEISPDEALYEYHG